MLLLQFYTLATTLTRNVGRRIQLHHATCWTTDGIQRIPCGTTRSYLATVGIYRLDTATVVSNLPPGLALRRDAAVHVLEICTTEGIRG